ncbi:flagellar biosynthesis protein FlhA [Bremerella sp. JC770]|uniref:flagellar biosynthesis protein FlhA n=1 Tax=Bremerella sp. JC770 TaxID=3232137 RepID=UPI00345811DD
MDFSLSRLRDLILPIGIITSVLVILMPLPAPLMNLLLTANITAGVIILLTTIYVKTPLEFNIFPSLLLATTLARLVLNVATTRLILTGAASEGMDAAGGVIQSFGEFVAGDRVEVGIIIFIIIVLIQFLVITKGATRISEVAARFALDGMPGRQMAIDADLNAGIIDEVEAQQRRAEITQQADFFGAMDGASKFVRGDAIAGIVITLINIVGGLIIGVSSGLDVLEAAQIYTKLTIGDGLVSQVPAFLISLAAGLLVTRSTEESNLPVEFIKQLFSRPEALGVAGCFLGLLIFSGLPTLPLLVIGAGCVGIAVMTKKGQTKQTQTEAAETEKRQKEEQEAAKKDDRIEDYLTVDPMEMELGVGLVRLAAPARGGDLLPRITGVRQNVASEIGVILPKVRIRDNMRLHENQYRIKISNNVVAENTIYPDGLLAIAMGGAKGNLPGEQTRDPAFNQPAVWIEPGMRPQAEMMGYTIVEPTSVLATHLQRVSKKHADELLTRDATKHLLDELKETSPAVVDELIPGAMKIGDVQAVLQLLLREEVSIRQLARILETLGDHIGRTKDPVWLTEFVRHKMARTICTKYRDKEGRIYVVPLDPAMQDRIASGIDMERGAFARMSPQAIEMTCKSIGMGIEKLREIGKPPIVLVNPQIRPAVKQLTGNFIPDLIVLSHNEITNDTMIESMGIISDTMPGKNPPPGQGPQQPPPKQ